MSEHNNTLDESTITQMPTPVNNKTCTWCTWNLDDDGAYYVKCDDFRVEFASLPDDEAVFHAFVFCPYCGRRLKLEEP